MLIETSEAFACAICGAALDVDIARLTRGLAAAAADALRRRHPAWRPDDGACPDCVLRAFREARREENLLAGPGEPFPLYGRGTAQIIPTPVRVHANPAFTGRGVAIAFLDSGFYPHPDLTEPVSRILAHVDATAAVPFEQPHFRRAEATSWHGLMVSAMAAGNGHASGGLYRAIASDAGLVLVKTGNRRSRRIPDRDILRALQWVVENAERFGIRIVNISLGGDVPSTGEATPLDALVEEAVAQGLVVVAAAGNGGVQRIIPPASAVSAITVGGLDDQNTLDRRYWRMWRSSFGRGVGLVPKPDLIAPSVWVPAPMLPRTWVHNEAGLLWQLQQATDRELAQFLGTDLARARFKKESLRLPLDEVRALIRRRITEQKYIHPHYQHVDGTSMAAPIVSAVVAQMLEANPGLAPRQIKQILVETAEPLRYVPREEQGHGVLDAARALALARRAPGGALAGLPVSPHVTPEAVTFVCSAADAHDVALVASFNGWQPARSRMHAVRPGVWQLTLPPPPRGEHAYKYLIDGHHWIHDVENPVFVEDGSGGFHSLLTIT